MGIGYLVAYSIGSLIVGCIFGMITRHVAESKGYEGGFAWGFWLGIIGLLVVGLRPNLETQQIEYKPMYPNAVPEKTTWESTWECGCGSKNPSTLDYCLSCRRRKGELLAKAKVKKCPHCGANNSVGNEVCFVCNKPMKEKSAQVLQEKGSVGVDDQAIKDDVAQANHEKTIISTSKSPVEESSARSSQEKVIGVMTAKEVADMLETLAQLRDKGILSEEEFTSKKADILSRV